MRRCSPLQEDKEKAVRDICDVMRRRGGVEWRSAVVHEERKEFFRGKDMLRFFEADPEKLDDISDSGDALCVLVTSMLEGWKMESQLRLAAKGAL